MEITAIVLPPKELHLDHHHHHHHETKLRKEKKAFFLETYLQFLHTRDVHSLTVDHLNKIISIHGYKKVSSRKLAEEAVAAISEPINPARSTLEDDIPSSKGTPTVAETMRDLKLLNWQECSISSIRTISSKNCLQPDDLPLVEIAAKLISLKNNKRCKLSNPSATSITSNSNARSMDDGCASGACSSSSSKMPPIGIKKKRNKRASIQQLLYTADAVTALAAPLNSK